MVTTVSAPGKIHLLGEHSAVYGKPALLSAIDKRLTVRIAKESSGNPRKKVIIHATQNDRLILRAINVFQTAFSLGELPPLDITVTSDIPIGSGLGSSAAVAAATIGALMKSIKKLWNPHRINELAFEVEKIAHGNASGADNTTIVFGGLVWYRKEFDFLRSIWSLPLSGYTIPKFCMIQSGEPKESTKEMVARVAQNVKKNPALHAVIADQEAQTKRLLLALRTADTRELALAMHQGERNLERLGVVGKRAKILIRDIENAGGAAKISGAGGLAEGSGILLCYHPNHAILKQIAEKYRSVCMPVTLGAEGIRMEKTEEVKA